jgi:hypothetical protein
MRTGEEVDGDRASGGTRERFFAALRMTRANTVSGHATSGDAARSRAAGGYYRSAKHERGTVLRRKRPLLTLWLASLVAVAIVVVAGGAGGGTADGSAFAKSKPESWKAIEDALLRVNDVPVKDWSVYQAGKKTDPLLLQMGSRFLLIEIHERKLFELDPTKIEHKSEDVVWDPANRPANPLATSDWIENDIGGAYRIGAKIDGEGRVLDLQLPHPPNIGALPARTATPRRGRGGS